MWRVNDSLRKVQVGQKCCAHCVPHIMNWYNYARKKGQGQGARAKTTQKYNYRHWSWKWYISQRKNNNQNKIDVFFIIFKIYWSVKSGVLKKRRQEVLNLFFDPDPLTHRTVALISTKLSLSLIQYVIVLHVLCHLSHRRSANLLKKAFASLPIRPSTEKQSGVKLTCFSSYAIRYLDFFSVSAFLSTDCGVQPT